jgi:CheY-like chemotaxis protein
MHRENTVVRTRTTAAAKQSILVVDADDDTRALYRESFAIAGCDVVEASDGREALTEALARPPALVITETRLPFIDGYALCEILRRDRATADVPILVVTAEARPADVDRARRAGANAVLVKPTTPDILVNETRRLLAQSRHLRRRAAMIRGNAATQCDRSADLLARAETLRGVRARSHQRFTTMTPPALPPPLMCPSCDRPLTYQESCIGGVSERHPEQWDFYVCAWCGAFEYRQRTRKLRSVV